MAGLEDGCFYNATKEREENYMMASQIFESEQGDDL
jgi:hypothetical protein